MQPKTFLSTALAIASIRRGPRAKQVWVFRFRLLGLPQSHVVGIDDLLEITVQKSGPEHLTVRFPERSRQPKQI
jgi:hypothetical protein